MPDDRLELRCQRCGTQMEMRDPAPGAAWAPQQFWVCPACSRHFWTTHPQAPGAKPADAAADTKAPGGAKPGADAKPAPAKPTAGAAKPVADTPAAAATKPAPPKPAATPAADSTPAATPGAAATPAPASDPPVA